MTVRGGLFEVAVDLMEANPLCHAKIPSANAICKSEYVPVHTAGDRQERVQYDELYVLLIKLVIEC